MSDIQPPSKLLCLRCAGFVDSFNAPSITCSHCGSVIDKASLQELYEYAADAYYYGHQYRKYYERAYQDHPNPPKPSLAFQGEVFAWLMLVVLSGIIGNASYDLVKIVIAKIREDIASGQLPARNYSPFLELSDDEIGDLLRSGREFYKGMEGLTREVRLAIIEEIVADSVAHNLVYGTEMMKLMSKKKPSPKDRKNFAKLVRKAVIDHKKRLPEKSHFNDLWTSVRRNPDD